MRASFDVAVLWLVQFLDIYISQRGVRTGCTCGGIFSDTFIADFPETVPVKEF